MTSVYNLEPRAGSFLVFWPVLTFSRALGFFWPG